MTLVKLSDSARVGAIGTNVVPPFTTLSSADILSVAADGDTPRGGR